MATFTLEEIGRRVSELPPLADPVLEAALAFIEGLGGFQDLKQEHLCGAGDDDQPPLHDAIARLIDMQNASTNWDVILYAKLDPAVTATPPAEYGL